MQSATWVERVNEHQDSALSQMAEVSNVTSFGRMSTELEHRWIS